MATHSISMKNLCMSIVKRLKNKFDVILVIDGERGLGKSTIAYHICKRVKSKLGNGYFIPERDIYYSREEVIRAYEKKKHDVIFADEMINVSYNRDWYAEDQKKLVKMLNMYRDSCNLFICCIPYFTNLDRAVRDLVTMRITVLERGKAIVQMKRNSIYTNDPWDTKINEKIQNRWKESGKYKYKQLTTFEGVLHFNELPERDRIKYDKIKADKRNRVMFEQEEKDKKDNFDPLDRMADWISKGDLNRDFLKNYAVLNGITYTNLVNKLRFRLEKKGIKRSLGECLNNNKSTPISNNIAVTNKTFKTK